MYKVEIRNNTVLFDDEELFNCVFERYVTFKGKNNVLYIGSRTRLHHNCRITFNGNNALAYLSTDNRSVNINLHLHQDNVFYLGKNNSFNGTLTIIAAESKNVLIGDDCLFSFGIFIRTSDSHLIYARSNNQRINHSKSVYINNHVWVAQNSFILKGSIIHSGSIIGAHSLVHGELEEHSIYAGIPARIIRKDIYWLKDSNHNYTELDTVRTSVRGTAIEDTEEYIMELSNLLLKSQTSDLSFNLIFNFSK